MNKYNTIEIKWAKYLNRHFSKENKEMTIENMLNIMQIKIRVRYNFIFPMSGYNEKGDNNKCWRGVGEVRTLMHCWCDGEIEGIGTSENSLTVSQMVKQSYPTTQ
jgi:hypothetical protein